MTHRGLNVSDSDHLNEIKDLIGYAATVRLLDFADGKTLRIPESQYLSFFHWLPVIVGMDKAFLICERFTNQTLILPTADRVLRDARDKQIWDDFKRFRSVSAVSIAHQVDRKLVQKIIHKVQRQVQP